MSHRHRHVTLGPVDYTPSHEHIAVAAYFIWRADGCQSGKDARNWKWAQEQLRISRLSFPEITVETLIHALWLCTVGIKTSTTKKEESTMPKTAQQELAEISAAFQNQITVNAQQAALITQLQETASTSSENVPDDVQALIDQLDATALQVDPSAATVASPANAASTVVASTVQPDASTPATVIAPTKVPGPGSDPNAPQFVTPAGSAAPAPASAPTAPLVEGGSTVPVTPVAPEPNTAAESGTGDSTTPAVQT